MRETEVKRQDTEHRRAFSFGCDIEVAFRAARLITKARNSNLTRVVAMH